VLTPGGMGQVVGHRLKFDPTPWIKGPGPRDQSQPAFGAKATGVCGKPNLSLAKSQREFARHTTYP
jgi:hypothetical protein